MQQINIIKKFVEQKLKNTETGHNYQHAVRVWKLTKIIADSENINNTTSVEAAALMHDIIDRKISINLQEDNRLIIKTLRNAKMQENEIENIKYLMKNVSFSKAVDCENNIELAILQDADRLDAIGAIGIARVFSYAGYKKQEIFNPNIEPKLNLTPEEYKKYKSTAINHFHEKLLKLKDTMNTKTAKKIALERHNFLLLFLKQFEKEYKLIS